MSAGSKYKNIDPSFERDDRIDPSFEKDEPELEKISLPQAFVLSQPYFPLTIFKKPVNDNRGYNQVVYALKENIFEVDSSKLISIAYNSWVESCVESESTERLKLISRDAVTILKEFASLEDDWDSYGAKKITISAIARAISFFINVVSQKGSLPQPFISPSPCGGIDFEWQTCLSILNHRIPADPDGFHVYAIKDKSKKDLRRTVRKLKSIQEMEDVVVGWLDYNQQ